MSDNNIVARPPVLPVAAPEDAATWGVGPGLARARLAPVSLAPRLLLPRAALAATPVWLDVSRLLWRVFRGVLTGIDRVELAYAQHLLAEVGPRLSFVAFDYRGGFAMLPRGPATALVHAIGPAWEAGTLRQLAPRAWALWAGSVLHLRRLPRARPGAPTPVYLNVSHHPLAHTGALARMLARAGAAFVPLVHDLIPLEYPEYVAPIETARHRRRLATVASLATGVLTNSYATAMAVAPSLPEGLPVRPVTLGVTARRVMPIRSALDDGTPFFLCLGTIEPRKNHLVLLHLWRRMVEQAEATGQPVPRLLIVGQRGRDNVQVFDMLDRCDRLRPHVIETGVLSDAAVAGLMARARALLMPSFVEGFGLPVAEALASGLPVLASDIAAHREIGGAVPEYLDPLDGAAWQEAVSAYVAPDSPRRAAQLRRLAGWEAPGWPGHIDAVLAFIEDILTHNGRPRAEARAMAPQPAPRAGLMAGTHAGGDAEPSRRGLPAACD